MSQADDRRPRTAWLAGVGVRLARTRSIPSGTSYVMGPKPLLTPNTIAIIISHGGAGVCSQPAVPVFLPLSPQSCLALPGPLRRVDIAVAAAHGST